MPPEQILFSNPQKSQTSDNSLTVLNPSVVQFYTNLVTKLCQLKDNYFSSQGFCCLSLPRTALQA